MPMPLYTCTASYEVMLVTYGVLADLMPEADGVTVSEMTHALHAQVPDLDATDSEALLAAIALVA